MIISLHFIYYNNEKTPINYATFYVQLYLSVLSCKLTAVVE